MDNAALVQALVRDEQWFKGRQVRKYKVLKVTFFFFYFVDLSTYGFVDAEEATEAVAEQVRYICGAFLNIKNKNLFNNKKTIFLTGFCLQSSSAVPDLLHGDGGRHRLNKITIHE